VLLGEALGDPDDGHRLQAGGVGEELAEVGVVGALQLVLDEHPGVVVEILAQDVGAEGAHLLFLGLHLQDEIQGLAQQSDVLFLGQPRSKIIRLAGPDGAEIHAFQAAEIVNINLEELKVCEFEGLKAHEPLRVEG